MLVDWSISKDRLVISKYLHVNPDYSFFMSCLIIFCVYINIPICNLRIWWRRWFHVWNEEGSQRGDRGTIYEEWKNVIRGVNCLCDGERNLILVFSTEELRKATYNCNPLQIFWMQMVFTFTRVLWKITYFQLKSMAKDHGLYWRDDQRHCHWITNECPPKCSKTLFF